MAGTLFKRKLIHQCTIQRDSTPNAQTASGEPDPTWGDSSTEDCRYVQKEERIAQEGVSLQLVQRDMLLLDAGIDILEEDRIVDIVWKVDGTSVDAGPFTIQHVLHRNTKNSHHISVLLERVE